MEKLVALPVESIQQEEDAEQVLVEQAKTDPTAFGVLYERYVMYVYHYLRTHVEIDEDARDLTQQVFLKALAALPGYRARGIPFKAWLFQIASHLATDTYRRRKKHMTWDLLPEAMHPLSEQNPETLLLEHEAQARLRHLLLGLTPYNRELLALRFAAQLSSTEIAKVVGKSPAAVKKQLTRLLQTLKEAFYEA
ncbi:MAG: RNA polymerase sigma factor [Ktedonobacteraceae bacterium]